mgnify:CR=1 FL=1
MGNLTTFYVSVTLIYWNPTQINPFKQLQLMLQITFTIKPQYNFLMYITA